VDIQKNIPGNKNCPAEWLSSFSIMHHFCAPRQNGMSEATTETFSNLNNGRANPSATRVEMGFQGIGGEKNHKASWF
jgi:hypothetical protein